MGYWNTRGLRGSALEEFINAANSFYMDKNLAVIQKVPTPITPVEISNNSRTITKAFFEQKSTVDYIGVVQGIPVCFDAKETALKSFPLKNIHSHQISFMEKFEGQKGIAFLIVYFRFANEFFLMPLSTLKNFYAASLEGKGKSIPYSEFDKRLLIEKGRGVALNYLEALNTYLGIMNG